MPQEDDDGGQMNKPLEIFGMILVANNQAAEVEKPAPATLARSRPNVPTAGIADALFGMPRIALANLSAALVRKIHKIPLEHLAPVAPRPSASVGPHFVRWKNRRYDAPLLVGQFHS
jgi:hypothetical protein